MHIEPLSKGTDICGQKVSERKSCLEINNARLGLSEAGELLQSCNASI